MRCLFALSLLGAFALTGCGTTRWTDTSRTATEQMLISDAIERAVSRLEFQHLAKQSVYLDTSFLNHIVDRDYLVSTLRQHLVASGAVLKDSREEADFVVEARAGAIGTDRHDLLYGIPALNLPISPIQGAPTATPEIALARRTDQKGVAKVAVFVYHRATGEPVWQSGVDTIASKAQDSWFLGMGPVQKGTIYDRAQFAGRDVRFPLLGGTKKKDEDLRTVRVTRETKFNDPVAFAEQDSDELAKFSKLVSPKSETRRDTAAPRKDDKAPGSSKNSQPNPPSYTPPPSVPSESPRGIISAPPDGASYYQQMFRLFESGSSSTSASSMSQIEE